MVLGKRLESDGLFHEVISPSNSPALFMEGDGFVSGNSTKIEKENEDEDIVKLIEKLEEIDVPHAVAGVVLKCNKNILQRSHENHLKSVLDFPFKGVQKIVDPFHIPHFYPV